MELKDDVRVARRVGEKQFSYSIIIITYLMKKGRY